MKRGTRYALSGFLTLLCLAIAFRGADPGQLLEAAGKAHYGWIAVSFLLLMISHVFRALRWRSLLDPLKRSIGFRSLFSGVMIGYLLNNVLPRAGELARPYAVARLEGIPVSGAFGTVVVERMIDTLTFLLLVMIAPLLYTGPLAETFPWLIPSGITASAVIALAVASTVTLMMRRDWTDGLLGQLMRILPKRLGGRVSGMAHSFLDGFLFLTRPRSFLRIAVLSGLIWLLYGLMTYCSFIAFGLEGTLGVRAAFVVLAISSVGIAIPTPGGTGSYHILVTQTLTGLFGVSGPLALSYATVTHAASFAGITLVGAYFLWRNNLTIAETVHAAGEVP